MQETWVRPLGLEDHPEKEMTTHCSILAWKVPWTEEPGRLQSMGLQKSQTWLSNQTMTKWGFIIHLRETGWASGQESGPGKLFVNQLAFQSLFFSTRIGPISEKRIDDWLENHFKCSWTLVSHQHPLYSSICSVILSSAEILLKITLLFFTPHLFSIIYQLQ